ncbi:MAG TPA: lipopolysaccharide assembly protein LapA domain-containing protein [Acidimicrobiales bacterium]|nr:lipopolysaccharide assembly protein LapA domain-containing protein [Acidimicrobiales bacterium]
MDEQPPQPGTYLPPSPALEPADPSQPEDAGLEDAGHGAGLGDTEASALPGLDVAPGAVVAPSDADREPHTRASGLWAAVVGCLAVLVVLIVFILENTGDVHVNLFGAHFHLLIGVALLIAAVFGGFVVVLAGTVRILELRRRGRVARRRAAAESGP